ncbi:MAG TPA: lytic transglycosylase domain-containing protein [Burkholderiaceae bacterium]|nr:lytic transglycosylase domain-containing protein [Burkholderiaceae bacterium]
MKRTAAALATSLGGSMLAHAALWGYVDGAGVAHFAERQLDSRYGLVLGDETASASAPERVPGKVTPPSTILTWLEIAPEVKRVQPWVREASARSGVDSELINALIAVESGFNARAVSPKGAVGLMQIMPTTAAPLLGRGDSPREVAARLAEPRTNIGVGARLMADLLKRHQRIDLALAAWSAGDEAVRRSGGQLPPIGETRAHVQQVLELYWALLQRRQSRGAQQLKLHP